MQFAFSKAALIMLKYTISEHNYPRARGLGFSLHVSARQDFLFPDMQPGGNWKEQYLNTLKIRGYEVLSQWHANLLNWMDHAKWSLLLEKGTSIRDKKIIFSEAGIQTRALVSYSSCSASVPHPAALPDTFNSQLLFSRMAVPARSRHQRHREQ